MSSYRGNYGAMAAYAGISDTLTNWPTVCGGSDGPTAFLCGIVGQYLTGAAQSTMSRRGVAVYSNLSSTGSFAVRGNTPGAQLMPAIIGPQPAFFPIRTLPGGSIQTRPY